MRTTRERRACCVRCVRCASCVRCAVAVPACLLPAILIPPKTHVHGHAALAWPTRARTCAHAAPARRYRRFQDMFGDVVLGIPHKLFERQLEMLKVRCHAASCVVSDALRVAVGALRGAALHVCGALPHTRTAMPHRVAPPHERPPSGPCAHTAAPPRCCCCVWCAQRERGVTEDTDLSAQDLQVLVGRYKQVRSVCVRVRVRVRMCVGGGEVAGQAVRVGAPVQAGGGAHRSPLCIARTDPSRWPAPAHSLRPPYPIPLRPPVPRAPRCTWTRAWCSLRTHMSSSGGWVGRREGGNARGQGACVHACTCTPRPARASACPRSAAAPPRASVGNSAHSVANLPW